MAAKCAKSIVLLASIFWLATTGARLDACSAQEMVNTARGERVADQHKAATDVAIEMLDREGWNKTPDVIDAATGTLLSEAGSFEPEGWMVKTGGLTADQFREVLDYPSGSVSSLMLVPHGLDTTGKVVQSTVRAHMRLHTFEVAWKEWAATPYYANVCSVGPAANDGPGYGGNVFSHYGFPKPAGLSTVAPDTVVYPPAKQPAPAQTPAPVAAPAYRAPVAPVPAAPTPVQAPVPVLPSIDHAG